MNINGFYVGNTELSDDELSRILFPQNYVGAMVNFSFCAEILLKSMIDEHKKTHKLRELFNEIDERWKKIIKAKINYSENIFDFLLEENSNSFEDWRYYYEKNKEKIKGDFKFLRKFTVVLMTVAYNKYYYEIGELDKIEPEDLVEINKVFRRGDVL